MINLTIVEIPEDEINADDPSCIINAFPFMAEDDVRLTHTDIL